MSGGIAFVLLQMGASGCPTPGLALLELRRLESSRRGDAGEDCRKAGCRQAMGSRCPNDPCHRNRPAGPQVLKSSPGTATRNNEAIALRGCVANARFRTAILAKAGIQWLWLIDPELNWGQPVIVTHPLRLHIIPISPWCVNHVATARAKGKAVMMRAGTAKWTLKTESTSEFAACTHTCVE